MVAIHCGRFFDSEEQGLHDCGAYRVPGCGSDHNLVCMDLVKRINYKDVITEVIIEGDLKCTSEASTIGKLQDPPYACPFYECAKNTLNQKCIENHCCRAHNWSVRTGSASRARRLN